MVYLNGPLGNVPYMERNTGMYGVGTGTQRCMVWRRFLEAWGDLVSRLVMGRLGDSLWVIGL